MPLPRTQRGPESLVPFHFNDAMRWLLTIQFTPAAPPALKAVPNRWLPSNDIAGRAGPHFHTVIPSCLNYWQGSSPIPIQIWESRPLFCLLMGTVFPFPILVLQGFAFWALKDVLMRGNVPIFICKINRCSCPVPVSFSFLVLRAHNTFLCLLLYLMTSFWGTLELHTCVEELSVCYRLFSSSLRKWQLLPSRHMLPHSLPYWGHSQGHEVPYGGSGIIHHGNGLLHHTWTLGTRPLCFISKDSLYFSSIIFLLNWK